MLAQTSADSLLAMAQVPWSIDLDQNGGLPKQEVIEKLH
jgi:hypothetical protein